MADPKSVQEAEARARDKAGIDPALNTTATEGTEGDGTRAASDAPREQKPINQEQTPKPIPIVKSRFDLKREEILKGFRGDRGAKENEARDEISDFQRSGMPPEFEPPAEVRSDDGQSIETEAAAAAETEGTQPEEQPLTVKVKVHGVEREVPIEEIIAHAQKSMAADNLLESAKTQAKELEALVAQARDKVARADRPDQHQVRQPSTQPTTEGQQADQPADQNQDPLLKLIESMQFGDPNEAAPILRNTIAEQVQRGVQQQLEMQRLQDEGARTAKVLADFETKHPDVAKDPMARAAIEAALLNRQVEDIKALGVDLNQIRPDGQAPTPGDIALAHRWYRSKGFRVSSPETMLEDATQKFLAWKGPATQTPAEPPPPVDKAAPRIEISVERRQRAAAVPQPPKPTGTTPPRAAPAAPQSRDRSEIVAAMMGARNKPRGRVGITS